ncbi:hypothetical protein GOBAR_AA02524 [Gossypium barbadense]|uniref:Uncharacterized protein n=1 Tax=Gossypium barbadense TaxID=3634 RepID=A0A2P5YR17_GOSBA|nr:hypothetical protein GOBAR_AA02524 [Gossypium barbadense]
MSETHFQNTEIALKNQQASIQGLKTQIGQLAKLISERPQGSLLSNTESDPREQLNAITTHDKERLVEPAPELRQGIVVSQDKGEVVHNNQKLTHILRTHDKPKPHHNELTEAPNQLKVGDKVLLDGADPRIATSEPNGVVHLTVLNIFPYGTVEVIHPKFDTFKAHRRALGRAHTTGGDKAIRYGCATWPWAKLPKQHGHRTRSCLETVVEHGRATHLCHSPVVDTIQLTREWKKRTKQDTAVRHDRVHPHA